ncbi:MAG: polysaccharide deacetylase family protein [Kofleriaceae bacterium]
MLLVATLGLLPSCLEDDGDADEEAALFEQAYDEGQQEPPKEDGTDCSGVRVPDRTGFDKRIALTFDDGPNPDTTPQVIEVLKRHHAPATFFTNGVRYASAAAKAVAARIAADPDYLLANHSQNHIDLAKQSAAKVATEIDRTDALIREAGETPRYFRFPFGSATCSSKAAAQSRGYLVTGWHIDSADWCFAAGGGVCKKSTFKYVPDSMRNDMKAYVMSQVRSTNGGIILFHDIHQSTANALDAILTELEAAGFRFVRLDDQAAFPRLHGIVPPPPQFIGDACTTNAQCGFTAAGQPGTCHPAGFCTISCAGSCPDLDGKAPTFCIADARSTTAAAGMCVSKSATLNGSCAALAGTAVKSLPRFVGTSGASAATANVCAPR